MWVAKIKYSSKNTLIGKRAYKYNVDVFGFPISFSEHKNKIIVHITGTIFGKEKDKKDFVKNLKKDKRTYNFELNEDFFIGTIIEPSFGKIIYNKDILHTQPAFISKEGFEKLTLGSFNRTALTKVINILEKKYGGKLISIQNKKIKSISIMNVRPELTEKQRKALELAIENGYYHSPRKIDIKQLSKLSGLSFSTFQVHLRKAEGKIIPYSFE